MGRWKDDAKTFLSASASPIDILVARVVLALAPQAELMFQMLMVASGEWEKKQQLSLKETGSRQWRVVEATKCVLELEALVKVRKLLCEDWSWLSTARTCKLASTIFRFVARIGAAICQLLVVRRIGCPYRVFALLEDASMVDSLLSTRRCCLDEWSHRLLQEHCVICLSQFEASLWID